MDSGLLALIHSHTVALLNGAAGAAWGAYILARDYDRALQELDAGLVSEGNIQDAPGLEMRLWWIRCQLELQRVPLTVLTSPMEEIVPTLKEQHSLYELGAITFSAVAHQLAVRNQHRLAIVVLERACQFGLASAAFTPQEKQVLEQALRETLMQEMRAVEAKAEVRSGRKEAQQREYLVLLEKKLEGLSSALKTSGEQSSGKPPKKSFTAKSILEYEPASSAVVQNSTAAKAESIATQPPLLPPVAVVRRGRSPIVWISMVLCLLALVLWGGWNHFFSGLSQAELLSRMMFPSELVAGPAFLLPAPRPPQYARLGVIDSGASPLRDIGTRLEGLSAKDPDSDRAIDRATDRARDGQELEQTDQSLQISAATGGVAGEGRNDQEQIDRSHVEQDIQQANQDKIPSLNTQKLGSTTVQAVDDTLLRSPVGRYDPPLREGRGEPLQAYEVERFDPPARFRIIASTDVLSDPSFLAKSLARLERDATISVVARMGQWLELRSTGGRTGFIYAQDAVLQQQ